MHGGRIDHGKAMAAVTEGSNAYLYRMRYINKPFAFGSQKHRAMIKSFAVVFPGIDVRVEMDQCQGTVLFGVRA